jgi:hypothetical protein
MFLKEERLTCTGCAEAFNTDDRKPMIMLQCSDSFCTKCIRKLSKCPRDFTKNLHSQPNSNLIQTIKLLSKSTRGTLAQTISHVNTRNQFKFKKLCEEECNEEEAHECQLTDSAFSEVEKIVNKSSKISSI